MAEQSPEILLNLPATIPGGEVEELVFDGQLVEEEAAPGRATLVPVRAAAAARRPARAVARHGSYVAAGIVVAVRRRNRRRTLTGEMARLAAARGDMDKAMEWAKQDHEQAQQRAERRRRAWEAAGHLLHPQTLKGTAIAVAAAVVLLVMSGWMRYLVGLYHLAAVVLAFAWGARWAVPPAVLLWLWHLGRTRADLPLWLMPAARREEHEGNPVTPSILVTALRDLGLPVLRKAVQSMDDGAAQMLGLITSAGCGIEVDVYLPTGVSTSEVRSRREKLAENVGRHNHELFMTVPGRPRTVRLWIADSGALDEPIGSSPLVTDRAVRADYRTGRAPWGQSLRGEPSTVSVFQRHVLVTGISNHGKTAALRALALWLSLSARVRFWIADFKGVGDWGMFDGLAEVLIQGPTDEHVASGTHMAEAGVAEMQERTTLMQELSGQGWTQEKILADPRFDPLVLIFDEAQKAYGCGAVGYDGRPYGGTKNTSRYFQAIKAIHDQGRAVCVTTWEGTQDPTNENLPKRTREGNHIRASLVVGTEAQAAMALGENAVAAGAAPHELRQGADKGVVVVAGDVTTFDAPRGQTFTIIRTHFIGDEDAAAIAARARKLRGGRVQARDEPAIGAARDLLDDLDQALGHERVKVRDAVGLLRQVDRLYSPYRQMTAVQLREALLGEGVRTVNASGTHYLDPADLRSVLARREAGE